MSRLFFYRPSFVPSSLMGRRVVCSLAMRLTGSSDWIFLVPTTPSGQLIVFWSLEAVAWRDLFQEFPAGRFSASVLASCRCCLFCVLVGLLARDSNVLSIPAHSQWSSLFSNPMVTRRGSVCRFCGLFCLSGRPGKLRKVY